MGPRRGALREVRGPGRPADLLLFRLTPGGAPAAWVLVFRDVDGTVRVGRTATGGPPATYEAVPALSPAEALAPAAWGPCALLRGAVRCLPDPGMPNPGLVPVEGARAVDAFAHPDRPGGARVPHEVPGLADAVAIDGAPSGGAGCARRRGGRVTCWGASPFVPGEGPTPADVGLTGVTQLAVGLRHACGLLEGGTVRCWGDDEEGQLGDGPESADLRRIEGFGLASPPRSRSRATPRGSVLRSGGSNPPARRVRP
jgi:hypothetical protein